VCTALQLTPFGCSDDETRPGLVADCNEPGCLRGGPPDTPPGSGLGTGGGAGSGGDGGEGGSGMPAPGAGTLAGNILELYTSDLRSTQGFSSGEVEVRAPDTEGDDTVTTTPAASGSYRLEDVFVGEAVWVGVGAFEDPPEEPYIDTLQAVNTSRSASANLFIMRRDVLSDVAANAFISNPLELDPEGAHAVVRFVTENGVPIEGVTVVYPSPGDVSVAYDAGDTYSDALDETSTRGTALILNMPAPPYPGRTETLVADIDGRQFSADVQLSRSAITVLSAVVPDP
jgi:hypothetical protein